MVFNFQDHKGNYYASARVSTATSFIEALRTHVQQQSQAITIRFSSSEKLTQTLTYHALGYQARAIVIVLQQRLAPTQRVLLLFVAGLNYVADFFGSLYDNAVPIAVYPSKDNWHAKRLRAIVNHAEAQLILMTKTVLERIRF